MYQSTSFRSSKHFAIIFQTIFFLFDPYLRFVACKLERVQNYTLENLWPPPLAVAHSLEGGPRVKERRTPTVTFILKRELRSNRQLCSPRRAIACAFPIILF